MYSGITNNIYWGLRHGQSTANVEGIISSSLLVGCSAHGLTELGRQQSSESGSEVYEKIGLNSLKNTFIYSSPFLRAKQTAEKCIEQLQICQNLQSNNVKINRLSYNIRIQLRERDFGDLDGKPLHLYNDVWPRDAKSADNKSYGVESVNEVAYRCNEFIRYSCLNLFSLTLMFNH
jgi:broad specificity phosphatase PhoE